jgi:TPP-dependent pyruvate/acetoin dehydrogenase alpha subunit
VVEKIRQAATATVEEHRDRALSWPDPPPDARFEHVYS